MSHDPMLVRDLTLSVIAILATIGVVGYALFYMYKKSGTKE